MTSSVCAWVAPYGVVRSNKNTALHASIQRRRLLHTALAFAVFTSRPVGASDDPIADLDAFGKALSGGKQQQQAAVTSGYPNTPSPLPTSAKSAAELTQPGTSEEAPTLKEAIEKSSKQKRIDPRTHG